MNKLILFLLFLLPLSLIGQVESQFNGTLNVFSASRIGFTNTFTISGIFSSTTTSYTSANSATGDIVQVQSGTRFYWVHIYSIASNSGGVITCNVRDSSSTLTTFPTGKWSIFRPTPNLRLPLSPDGETNASRSATFNTLALKVDDIQQQVSSSTNCERTITKTAHGFRKWTPVYWTGSNYVRPTYDSLVPDYIVVDSLTANTFKVASCGTYPTVLPDGLYWFTNQSPGYSLTQDTTKAALFQVIDSTLILNPIVGFNLMSGSGSGDVTSSVLADTAAAIRADFPSGVSDGDKGDITVTSSGATWTIDNGVVTSAKVASQTLDSTDLKNRGTTLLKLAQSGATNGQVPKYNSATGNWETSGGFAVINGYAEIGENGTSNETYEIRKRDIGLGIPVPIIRPKTNNQVIALDIMPKGTPSSEYFDNGYAWIDVCDKDVQNNNSGVTTARIGARPSRIEFGLKSYGGAWKPLSLIYDTTAHITIRGSQMSNPGLYLRDANIYLQNPGTGTATQGLGIDSNNKIVTTTLGGGGSGISALTGDVTAAGSGSVAATISANVIDSTKVQNGTLSLNDLSQFGATSNQVLTWDNALSKWRPRTGSSITGINNQTLRINSGGTPEASSVLTNDGTNLVSTGRLTATGLSAINNATGATNGLVVRNQSASGYSNVEFRDNSDNFVAYWGYGNASIAPALLQGRSYIGTINKALVITTDANTTASIFVGTNSNVGLSTSSPGAKLHVVGDCIITSSLWLNAAKTVGLLTGTGSPEGAVTASVGSTFSRTDGGAGTSFYVKESGSGNTGWVAK